MSQQINLYNPLLLKQKKIFSARTMAQALGLIALGLAAVYGYARYQVANLQTETELAGKRQEAAQVRLARISQQFGPRQKSAELEASIKQAEAELLALAEVQAALKQGSLVSASGFSPYLKALARQAVEGVWLTGIEVTGSEMAISGRTLKPGLVPDYIHRLSDEQVMQGRKFAMLEMRQPEAIATKDGKPGVTPRYIEFTLQSALKEVK
ncbi:MAG: PilN domain-containing protein [Burkholderiales bacterium]|nr:PilN domain-containing protein [Burkholderiales bacterium]